MNHKLPLLKPLIAIGFLAGVQSLAVADVSSGAADARGLMQRVAATYAQNSHGVIGVRSQSVLTIKAPIFGRRIANDGWFVFVDGVLAQSKDVPHPRQPPFRDPYRAEYLQDYMYAYVPCKDCLPGSVAVAFSSPMHDVQHASGKLVVDDWTGRILSQMETPYKLPWPTKGGELLATWGAVGGGWFPLSISGNFVGKIGPFVGHATYAQSLTSYRRFVDVGAAAASLSSPIPRVAMNGDPLKLEAR